MGANRFKKQTASAPLRELRTAAPFYWLFGGIFGAVFVLSASIAITKDPDFWIPTSIMGLILVSILLWGTTTKLTLTHDAIHYRSFLVRVDIPLADVMKVEFATGFIAFSYRPYQRIVVTVRDKSGRKEIILNGGLFDRGEIKRWVETLNSRLK